MKELNKAEVELLVAAIELLSELNFVMGLSGQQLNQDQEPQDFNSVITSIEDLVAVINECASMIRLRQ